MADRKGVGAANRGDIPATKYPALRDFAASDDGIALYDQEHFLSDGRDGVREILRRDCEQNPQAALRCWMTRLARARWIPTTGFEIALARAKAVTTRSEPGSAHPAIWKCCRRRCRA